MSLDTVNGGGTVERTLQLHKALVELGVPSHILTINCSDSVDLPAKDITQLPCLNKRWFMPLPKMKVVRQLVEQADVIHLMNHWTLINAWVYVLAKKLGKPYVVCPAGALTIFGRSTFKKRLYQWVIGENILKDASAVIAISPQEIDLFQKQGVDSQKIRHLPNGVNDDDFRCCDAALFRKSFGIGAIPYILFVGRINEIKGPDLLLSAFAKLHDKFPHHLVFAGPDGGMTEQLKQQASELGLIERIHFTGYLGGDVKSSAYHGAEILVVSSRHEAMSIVALEAAISSTPVLLTDQCGFPSLADAGAAIEVPVSIDGISKGLEKILIDDCNLEEMGKCGRTFSLEHYTWSIIAKRFVELVSSVI